MVGCKSTTRLSKIKMSVILTQTDTTVGFLSQDEKKLYEIKSRETTKPFIKVYSNFKTLKSHGIRVPSKFKNSIRRAKKTTFVVKNTAFRVAKTKLNSQILRDLSWSFSTSANQSGKKYDREFCENKADIIVEDFNGLYESGSSKIIKINKEKKGRLR